MPRTIFLVHWNEAEAEALAAGLRQAGWTVEVEAHDGALAYRRIRQSPPAAVVVDLTRLPSHGVRTVTALQSNAGTRGLPILFVGGSKEAVVKARAKAPAATFVAPGELPGALRRLVSA